MSTNVFRRTGLILCCLLLGDVGSIRADLAPIPDDAWQQPDDPDVTAKDSPDRKEKPEADEPADNSPTIIVAGVIIAVAVAAGFAARRRKLHDTTTTT